LLVRVLSAAASLTAKHWDRQLSPANVPVAFQARLAQAFASLHARLPARQLTADDLWTLSEPPPGAAGAPADFAVARLVARAADRSLQFALEHVLRARIGHAIFDLLYGKRDVIPVDSADEAVVCLAVYDRPSARMQLERVCAPLLEELRMMVAGATSDATVELRWVSAVPQPPSRPPSVVSQPLPTIAAAALSLLPARTAFEPVASVASPSPVRRAPSHDAELGRRLCRLQATMRRLGLDGDEPPASLRSLPTSLPPRRVKSSPATHAATT